MPSMYRSLSLTRVRLAGIKKSLRATLRVPSCHLSEALASAFKFDSHAALLAALRAAEPGGDTPLSQGARILPIRWEEFHRRLGELGHPHSEWMAYETLRRALDAN